MCLVRLSHLTSPHPQDALCGHWDQSHGVSYLDGDLATLFSVAHWDSWHIPPLGMSCLPEQRPEVVTLKAWSHPDLTLEGQKSHPQSESQTLSSARGHRADPQSCGRRGLERWWMGPSGVFPVSPPSCFGCSLL